MVFDATAKAFSPSESTDGRSSRASTSTPVLPAIPGPTTRPAKRRRITQSGTMSLTPTPSPAPTPIVDLDALDAARRRAAGRVMSLWESLAEKYARPIEEDDEIDILTGKICRDRGVLRSVSERGWKIGSFGEALEVEPLVLVSEGETETGASEADDEGEGEDDTEGEGVESTEEGGEDPLGDWSYDWQYRVLPPPRPELSPQDAEDLKEFLAAENAIRESMRKNGEQPKPDDDDIVYLGDSMHNTDGTLRTDETSDDEFASMVMTDNSTIRYMKHEDDADEVDDIEPMASILGALALGRTPKKQALHLSSSSPKDEEMDMDTKIHPPLDSSQSDTLGRNHPSSGPQAGTIRPSTETSSSSILGLDVDDDLIVIDSDSDDEPEQIDNSRMKPGSPSKSVALPAGPSTTNARDQHVSSSVLATSSAFTSSPVTRSNRLPKESTAVATTPLDQSAARQSLSSTKRVPPALAGSPVLKHAPNKPVSQRVLGESAPRPKAPGSRTTTTKNHLKGAVLDSRSATKTLSTPTKKGSCRIPEADSRFKSPNEVEAPVSLSKRKAIASETEVGGKPSLSQDMTACLGLPARVDVSSPKVPISAPTASSSSPARTKSPLKRRKKATVVEVVLPALRKVPKVKRESTAPLAPASSKITTLTMARTAPNERSPEQPNELAPSSERPNSTSETTNPAPHTLLVVRSGVESELGLKRKRSLDGAEPTEGAGNALESRISVGSMGRGPDPLHACCSPAQLGPNQPPYCSAHPQCHAEPHPHAHTSHSAHVSCSAHHHPGLPIYQHQHQHQHLHTHLPYPLPQLPYTANELTEAAMKLIHGLSTFHRVSGTSSSPGTGFWLPAAQLPFGFTIPNQAGPSPQALAPKLEEPSSQEKISDECIPSSQEHERKAEAINTAVEGKPNQIPLPQPQLEDPTPAALGALIETHTEHKTATTSMIGPASSPNSKRPPPEREMSVIDIDSDSDDELAICDAGAGSMRWEPPVKKEVEVSMGLGYERQPSPRKSLVNGRASSRTSPVKLKRML